MAGRIHAPFSPSTPQGNLCFPRHLDPQYVDDFVAALREAAKVATNIEADNATAAPDDPRVAMAQRLDRPDRRAGAGVLPRRPRHGPQPTSGPCASGAARHQRLVQPGGFGAGAQHAPEPRPVTGLVMSGDPLHKVVEGRLSYGSKRRTVTHWIPAWTLRRKGW
jgi:hypothetical protein